LRYPGIGEVGQLGGGEGDGALRSGTTRAREDSILETLQGGPSTLLGRGDTADVGTTLAVTRSVSPVRLRQDVALSAPAARDRHGRTLRAGHGPVRAGPAGTLTP